MDETKRPADRADDVGELVRLAGDSTVSRERMERVRGVAKAQWREKTRRRSRNRTVLWLAAAAAAAVLAVTAWLAGSVTPDDAVAFELARVDSLAGRVTVDVGSGVTSLDIADVLPAGATVSTAGASGAALRMPGGHSLRLDEATEVELRSDGGVVLLAGALYLESDPARPQTSVDVHTPFGVVREIGTQFEVRLRYGKLRIRLREGAVLLKRNGDEHTIEAGTELNVDATGVTGTTPIATHGEAWDWVSTVAPIPDMSGRPAHDFLTWIAREKGWLLAFEDENALRAAQAAIVEGRLDSLEPGEALEAVLQASRLEHRVADGTLVVSETR